MAYSKKYQQGHGSLGRDAELAFFRENTVALPKGTMTPRNVVGPRTPELYKEQPGNYAALRNPVNVPDPHDGV